MDSIKKRSGFAAPFSFEFEYALLQPVFFRFRVPEIIGLAVDVRGIFRVTDHPHPAGMVMGSKILHDGFQRYGGRLRYGIAVNPGGDGGEVHGINAVLTGKLQTAPVASGQRRRFAMPAALPDGSYGVKDIPGL